MDPNDKQPPAPAPAAAPAPTTDMLPDAPDAETMQQIRQRRLEKLGTVASPPAPPLDSAPKTPAESSKTTPESHVAQPSAQPSETAPKIRIIPAAKKRPAATTSPGAEPMAPSQRRPVGTREETIEDFADKTLAHIFRVTVDPSREVDVHDRQLTFLPGVNSELEEEGKPLKLCADLLDGVILEAGTLYTHKKPLLSYLLPCWKRVVLAIKATRNMSSEKESVLKEARRLCFSHCIFAVTMPDLYGREHPESLMPHLLQSFDDEEGICFDFYSEAAARFSEDDTILPQFTESMVAISDQLAKMSMLDNYKRHVHALMAYSKFPPLVNALVQHPRFQMAQSAANIEKSTILGPFFRISPLQREVTKDYFDSPRTLEKGKIKQAQDALRMTLNAHQSDLKTIINAFIRAGSEVRNKVLDWFAYIINTNHKRRAMQVDPREVASDGFMVNVTVILDFLCEPFMDSTFSKIDRIDVEYFRRTPRVDISEETKLNADQSESDAFYATKAGGSNNFITEIFFLTLGAHQYGSEATNSKLGDLEKNIKRWEKSIAQMEAERPKIANRPRDLAMLEISLKRYTDVLEKAMSLKYAIEGVLVDEKTQGLSLQFMRYVSVWLLRVASQTDYIPGKHLKLPLPAKEPDAFKCLPEYALQAVLDNFNFIFRYVLQIILSAVGDEMIALCLAFLESSEYVRNPGLKSSLVSLLYAGVLPAYHRKKGLLGDILTNSKFANDYLLHAVMKFYIECESTGAHTAFYDKFSIRYEIFQVVKCVWSNDLYKEQLTQSSKTNRAFFVRFVNMLMNDATYVLDEALSKFPKIKELTEELESPALEQETREKKEEELSAAEGQARMYMGLANETVAMMKLFTRALSEAFTMPEIVMRLAGMLDYNMEILTGPKSRNLKVQNTEKYQFNPKTLMPEIVDIYLNLGSSQAFIEAVASDGRSYKSETFQATSRILRSRALKSAADLEAWDKVCEKIAAAKEVLDRAELDFGEVPAEFEDPIMGDLMKDPVILPSKHVVDRSTIIQHLLSDQKDPFTRQPMTIEDVVPEDELRRKIEAWKEERLAQARAQVADAMETTE